MGWDTTNEGKKVRFSHQQLDQDGHSAERV